MVHAGWVLVAGIHLSRTWMSWTFESVVMECTCAQTRHQFILSSERVFGDGDRTHVNSRGKKPLPEAQRRFEPVMLHQAGLWAHHTTNWAVGAPRWVINPAGVSVTSYLHDCSSNSSRQLYWMTAGVSVTSYLHGCSSSNHQLYWMTAQIEKSVFTGTLLHLL